MSDVIIIALIGAAPATLGAILGWKNRRQLQDVHVLVNSQSAALKKELEMALDEIVQLKKLLE